jgi:DNA invertase Pin-like site-specific DNA recombinase
MSTDKQEDSPARQRRDIEEMAKRHGYRILTWYEDHGLTGTESANRPEFKRLLENAKGGKFQAVLLSEQSRMSREDIFDVMIHCRVLLHGSDIASDLVADCVAIRTATAASRAIACGCDLSRGRFSVVD